MAPPPQSASSSKHPRSAPRRNDIHASGTPPQEPLGIDELWEPPTPDEWRRAVQMLALQMVRELAQRGVSLRLLRLLGWR